MRLVSSSIALVACTSLAAAADLDGPSYGGSLKDGYAAPVYNWTGIYVGAHGGWAGGGGWDGAFFNRGDATGYRYSLDIDGWYGGFQAGANQQFGRIVLGVETDVSFGDLNDSGAFLANNPSNINYYAEWDFKQELERFGTVRARLGYLPADNLLVYLTGGMAWGQTKAHHVIHNPKRPWPGGTEGTGNVDETHIGWTIGGGLEWALASNVSIKGEYLYVDLGKRNYHFVGRLADGTTYYADNSAPSNLDFHTVRVGLNLKFDNSSHAREAGFGGPYGYNGSIKDGPSVAAPTWAGLYVGVHGGWAGGSGWDGDLVWKDQPANVGYSLDADGWYGGIQAGANNQFGQVVVGIEADASFGDVSDKGSFSSNPSNEWKIRQDLERFGTVRGRLGYVPADNMLAYVTFGMAWGQVEASHAVHNISPPGVAAQTKVHETHIGWTIGGGLEWALTSNLSLRGEYLYVDLGKEDYYLVGRRTSDNSYYQNDAVPADLDFHTVRIGMNYKFGHR